MKFFLKDIRNDVLGTTLIEIIVVIAIISIVSVVAFSAVRFNSERFQLTKNAQEIALYIKKSRAVAIHQNKEVSIYIDVNRRSFWRDNITPKYIRAKRMSMKVVSEKFKGQFEMRHQIRFFPDGSSSGGKIVLMQNEKKSEIVVDWLTGVTRINED